MQIAEHRIYFGRHLKYDRRKEKIRLPEYLNFGFSSIIKYICEGDTETNPDNVYHIFVAADFLLLPKLKQQCANPLKEIATTDFSTANKL